MSGESQRNDFANIEALTPAGRAIGAKWKDFDSIDDRYTVQGVLRYEAVFQDLAGP